MLYSCLVIAIVYFFVFSGVVINLYLDPTLASDTAQAKDVWKFLFALAVFTVSAGATYSFSAVLAIPAAVTLGLMLKFLYMDFDKLGVWFGTCAGSYGISLFFAFN